jgi:DNA primase
MPSRIPPEIIDRLLSRIDIVDVIDARVHLKKGGKDYIALCPIHTEKSPSFTVSPDKQFYHCFGCGAHGSAIGFLMDYEHMSFREAVEELAGRSGMELPRDGTTPASNPDPGPSYGVLQRADTWFRRQLRSHPEAARAVSYLKERGLSGEIAAEYGLGYAPAGWNGLLHALGRDAPVVNQLVQNGLLVERSGRHFDRFRDRIMFPIRDRRGRTIGFGGRVLGDDKPKYLNSPETPLFHKGRELYGLFEARKALRRIDRLLVVEGYMDVIALAQFGIRYAVATLGTATTAEHLERLFRACDRLVFCFDGDHAGREAAWKALNVALPTAGEGREIRFLFLPEGEDPDTLVRRIGAPAFEQLLDSARPLSEVFFERLGAGLDLGSLDGQARLAELARPLIAQTPPGIYREMMSTHLARLTGLPPARLGLHALRHPSMPQTQPAGSMALVRRAIALLLQHPGLGPAAAKVNSDWRRLQQPDIALLAALLDLTQTQPNLSTAALVERWRDSEHFAELSRLAEYDLSGAQEAPQEELAGALRRLNEQFRGQETESLFSKSCLGDMTEDEKVRLKQLLSRSGATTSGEPSMER